MAGYSIYDRVQETTTTSGTGTYTLAGAVAGYQSFGVVGDGNLCYYCCTDGTNWEVGVGTYTLSGTTLARTTILTSSNSGSAVSWSSGAKNIFCTLPATLATSGSKTFSTPGAISFTVPAGVTKLRLTGIAGGGGGRRGGVAATYAAGSGGGTGEYCIQYVMAVTPGAVITGAIGAAGTGDTGSGGGNGGNTTFGNLVLAGGSGATGANNGAGGNNLNATIGAMAGGSVVGNSCNNYDTGQSVFCGFMGAPGNLGNPAVAMYSVRALNGSILSPAAYGAYSAGIGYGGLAGASTPWAVGQPGANAAANATNAGSTDYGVGGIGGGGVNGTTNGGAGGPGYLLVEWGL